MSSSEQIGVLVLAVFLAVIWVSLILWSYCCCAPFGDGLSIAERAKIDSPEILYVGIGLSGAAGLAAFMEELLVFGVVLWLMMLGCVMAFDCFPNRVERLKRG